MHSNGAEVDILHPPTLVLPALRQIGEPSAGLHHQQWCRRYAEFSAAASGLLTRISVRPPCAPIAYGITHRGVYIDALAAAYDG